jgi:hypothetical protein
LGALLGTALDVVTIPRPGWLAAELVELYDADNSGILQPRGDRRHRCATELDDTLRHVVRAAVPGTDAA